MKLCLIGSTRFLELFRSTELALAKDGHIVYSVATKTSSQGETPISEQEKIILDLVHLRKIAESEACVLITDETGYFGFSTKREMIWAQMIGKPIMDCRFPILAAYQDVKPRPDSHVLDDIGMIGGQRAQFGRPL